MFGARPEPDETRGQLAQNWKPFQQTEHEWKRSLLLAGHQTGNDSTMNKDLHPLEQASWPFAARLHCSQVANVNRTALQFFREQVCSRDCVLDGKIDSHTARR